ncbi:MAG: hypothetical protein HY699_19740 [Deltaproteobacteria bacterium]|nr:hypothetical protein [Deltaproteobacteria bacterium]
MSSIRILTALLICALALPGAAARVRADEALERERRIIEQQRRVLGEQRRARELEEAETRRQAAQAERSKQERDAPVALEAAANRLANDLTPSGVSCGKLALMPLLHRGQRTRFGDAIAERLRRALRGRGVTLVERDQLNRIVAEQKLGVSGLVDERTTAQIGRLAGADSLLFGTVEETGGSIVVEARVVSIGEGVVLAAEQAGVPSNDITRALLADVVTTEPPRLPEAEEKSNH